MKTENQKAKEHFQNQWIQAQPWAKKTESGYMPMVGSEEAAPSPVETEENAIEIAEKRRQWLIAAWK